ncbi:hypothetical protein L596_002555 [Steinernema carpocapsae]|uniref:Uncharacterized protein n=1 Tax=Steinernema carpocapsae TaxID=34508 RepID=A0A4U8URE5_STECR|nr:hypothetical protein L596_002555 [Steinernema carpocapsae]
MFRITFNSAFLDRGNIFVVERIAENGQCFCFGRRLLNGRRPLRQNLRIFQLLAEQQVETLYFAEALLDVFDEGMVRDDGFLHGLRIALQGVHICKKRSQLTWMAHNDKLT